jgi:hypothetical protein
MKQQESSHACSRCNRTRPIFDTREPEWNETFFFKNVRPDTLCKLYLLDKDVGTDDPLGETQFTAANTDGAETTFELPIKRGDRDAGIIVVKVRVVLILCMHRNAYPH